MFSNNTVRIKIIIVIISQIANPRNACSVNVDINQGVLELLVIKAAKIIAIAIREKPAAQSPIPAVVKLILKTSVAHY